MEIPFALVYVAVHEGLKRAVCGASRDVTAAFQSTNERKNSEDKRVGTGMSSVPMDLGGRLLLL